MTDRAFMRAGLTAGAAFFFSFLVAASAAAAAPPPGAIAVAVDASEATRGILHVHERVPVAAGPLTLTYPKWVPGEHAPNGPIADLAGLTIAADGRQLAWRRDLVNGYAFHLDVPAGATALDVQFDFLGTGSGQYSSARLATPNLLSLTWNKVVLTPQVADDRSLPIAPSLTLPGPDWQFASALDVASQAGKQVAFAPVTLEKLIDSTLDAGVNVRRFPLGSFDGAPVDLAVFADTPDELNADDKTIAKFRNLVQEMKALYGARHFDHYTFLLMTSDVLPGEGVEHHQSSDDGTDGDFLTDATSLAGDGDLLPHEFNHSWDGKYRRPADLATPNLQAPMQDDLLWVYEGMTQYYGELQAERSGLWTKEQWLDSLASTYASLDTTPGRLTRPLLDTAASGPFLYAAPNTWESERRSVDFYSEGNLMWLEASLTIDRLTGGKKSLDDVARAFFGRTDTGPAVVPYTRDDVIAALQSVAPFDWRGFFTARVDAIAPHPPDAFTYGGWRVTYTAKPSAFEKLEAGRRKSLLARYSLGIVAKTNGDITDVVQGSPAARAGIGPGAKILGINGRTIEANPQSQLDEALTAAKSGSGVRLLLATGNTYREVTVDYHGGPRYPHLERIAGTPDRLSRLAAARRGKS